MPLYARQWFCKGLANCLPYNIYVGFVAALEQFVGILRSPWLPPNCWMSEAGAVFFLFTHLKLNTSNFFNQSQTLTHSGFSNHSGALIRRAEAHFQWDFRNHWHGPRRLRLEVIHGPCLNLNTLYFVWWAIPMFSELWLVHLCHVIHTNQSQHSARVMWLWKWLVVWV